MNEGFNSTNPHPGGSKTGRLLACLLRPVVRFALRHSFKLNDINDICKQLLVEEGAQLIRREGSDVSFARLSMMTGVHRKDVSRLCRSEQPKPRRTDIIARVMGQWQTDPRFTTKRGAPRALSCAGAASEFRELVTSISREVNHYTVLFELERIGIVQNNRGKVRLLAEALVLREDAEEGFHMLSEDADDLIVAVEENVTSTETVPNLHLKTEYTNVPADKVPGIRQWIISEGSAFHRRVRNFLAQHDRDVNPELPASGASVRIAVAAFSRIESAKSMPKQEGRT